MTRIYPAGDTVTKHFVCTMLLTRVRSLCALDDQFWRNGKELQMKSMTQTLEQLRKEKEALNETIAALEQLSRELEKADAAGGREAKLASGGARPKMEKVGKR